MERFFRSALLIIFLSAFTRCTKEHPYGLRCAECIAYRKEVMVDPLTNEKYVELIKVHNKSWCDSQPIVIENFFSSYSDSFETLMEVAEYEYCIECETTTYLDEYLYYTSCD
jgi:hypothetical protein